MKGKEKRKEYPKSKKQRECEEQRAKRMGRAKSIGESGKESAEEKLKRQKGNKGGAKSK